MNITIVIPTHMDRTHYLKRALSFYSAHNFSGKILIGDSSKKPVLTNNKKLLNVYKNLNIKHIHYPKSKYPSGGRLVADITKYIDTDYVCFCGDDDFQMIETLRICIDFLDHNMDYIGAHGCKVMYDILFEKETNSVKIGNVNYARGQYLDVEDPVFRFRSYMATCTSPQYHVMRKSTWKEIYQYSSSLPDSSFLVSEILPCSLYYILGKVKRFDTLVQYMMEQTPISYQNTNPDYIIRGINSKEWGPCIIAIRDIIINKLIGKGVSQEEAEQAFDEEYNHRILSHYYDQFYAKYSKGMDKFNIQLTDHQNKHDQGYRLAEETLKGSLAMISTPVVEFIVENNK